MTCVNHAFDRRHFIRSAFVLGAAGLWLPRLAAAAGAPTSNPLAALRLAWTDKLRCGLVVDITAVPGEGGFWDERLEKAQQAVVARGGGVVFFPAGEYRFARDIKLLSGVILRGAEPAGASSALDEKFSPPSKIEFPKYTPSFTANGTPTDSAFKGVTLAEAAAAANCGLVHLAINRGSVALGEAEGNRCGANRF